MSSHVGFWHYGEVDDLMGSSGPGDSKLFLLDPALFEWSPQSAHDHAADPHHGPDDDDDDHQHDDEHKYHGLERSFEFCLQCSRQTDAVVAVTVQSRVPAAGNAHYLHLPFEARPCWRLRSL